MIYELVPATGRRSGLSCSEDIKIVELTGVKKDPLVKEWPLLNWKLTFHDGHTMN